MPSIHFQLDWKPLLTNSINAMEQEAMQFTKNPHEGIGTNRLDQQMEGSSGGLTSRNSCNGLATTTKRSSETANIIQNPIPNKPKVPLSISNNFKNTYNILKTGTEFLYEDKIVQTCTLSKLQGLKINRENNMNIIKQNQQGMMNANMSMASVKFSVNANPKVLSDANRCERKLHMARFTKDPEFPSTLKAIDCEVVNFIQLNQMRKCFKQISQDQLLCNSVFGHDAFYYASCLSRNARNTLVSEFPAAFNTWPQKNNSCLSAKPPECSKVQKMDKTLMTHRGCIKGSYGIMKSQQAGGDEKGNLNLKFLSYRWKHLLALLLKLPLNKKCIVDGILLPEQFKEYNINPR